MTRRNPPAKWVLPEVVEPPTSLCVTIRVPNETYYKSAFWGALLDLASAYKWQDDPAHTAKDVANVWRNIIDDLRLDQCPVEPTVPHGTEIEDDMGIRVDCDCNVWITCCDGTEMQLATVGMLDQPTQPGDGAPTPQPGGGCQAYAATIQGNGFWYSPAIVSTGDTIEVTAAAGATYNPTAGIWHCPDGDQFFAGACVGSTLTNAGNPLPAVKSGKLIANIGGAYYDVQGGPFTVPGGISDAAVTFLFNYDNLLGSSGEVKFNVNVCNNQAGSFSHDFDFVINPRGWSVRDIGQYTAGVGFEAVYSAPIMTADIQSPTVAAFTLTRMTVRYITSGQSGGSNAAMGDNTPGVYFHNVTCLNGDITYDSGIISIAGVTILYFDGFLDTSLATGKVVHVHIEGVGPDPF